MRDLVGLYHRIRAASEQVGEGADGGLVSSRHKHSFFDEGGAFSCHIAGRRQGIKRCRAQGAWSGLDYA